MKLYDITKSQLIIIWVLGIIVWLWSGVEAETNGGLYMLIFLILPFILLFYSLGWRKKHKKSEVSKINPKIFGWCKKLFLFIFIVVVISSIILYLRPAKISEAYLERITPYQYKLHSYHYVNLDNDKKEELIVFFEEDEFYNSNRVTEGEGLRFLPIKFTILDYDNRNWKVTSRDQRVDSDNYANGFVYTPKFANGLPYKVYDVGQEKILVLFTYNASFTGLAYEANLFRYRNGVGVSRVPIDDGIWASEGIIEDENSLIFATCNPFENVDSEKFFMKVKRLHLKEGFFSEDLTEEYNLDCDQYFDLYKQDGDGLENYFREKI